MTRSKYMLFLRRPSTLPPFLRRPSFNADFPISAAQMSAHEQPIDSIGDSRPFEASSVSGTRQEQTCAPLGLWPTKSTIPVYRR
jgi:hypothetical protein